MLFDIVKCSPRANNMRLILLNRNKLLTFIVYIFVYVSGGALHPQSTFLEMQIDIVGCAQNGTRKQSLR